MRAELQGIVNWDHPQSGWDDWTPDDPNSFMASCTAYVGGDDGSAGSDAFDFIVCTPDKLSDVYEQRSQEIRSSVGLPADCRGVIPMRTDIVSMQSVFVVAGWDADLVDGAIAELCTKTVGATWEQVATQLNEWLNWEFAYRLDPEWANR
jgi:Immunity protein 8